MARSCTRPQWARANRVEPLQSPTYGQFATTVINADGTPRVSSRLPCAEALRTLLRQAHEASSILSESHLAHSIRLEPDRGVDARVGPAVPAGTVRQPSRGGHLQHPPTQVAGPIGRQVVKLAVGLNIVGHGRLDRHQHSTPNDGPLATLSRSPPGRDNDQTSRQAVSDSVSCAERPQHIKRGGIY